jgi:hypothetical protein
MVVYWQCTSRKTQMAENLGGVKFSESPILAPKWASNNALGQMQKLLIWCSLNLTILLTVWNECVRFGGLVNIQVSCKILQLEVLKKALILHNLPCFQEGCFDTLDSMWPWVFRGEDDILHILCKAKAQEVWFHSISFVFLNAY